LTDGEGHIDVATTRVETMLGDTGVAVHPDDGRYRALVGRRVRHPFTDEELPVVSDDAVDPAFGTGAVKVTPAHDPTDFEIAERTALPRRNILTADATISGDAPAEFRGLDRYEARLRVLEALRERGLVIAEERPYRHAVAHCYRCNAEIEPWLSGKQWFVAVDRLKGPAKDAAVDGRIRFFPDRWRENYTTWLDNLRDWNISRQLWWGHRIPVWYCPNGHEFASVDDPDACRECGEANIEQDGDVLDTWFSSQLWPFSTLGWPDETADLAYFYPTTVLVTGYEILYLWVARMIMSGLYLAADIPFGHVLIHGLVRDERNRKMSKSLGNVIDPLEFIGKYGADALRFALARIASPDHQNYPLGERDVEAARNFANKVWNAGRFVLRAYEGGAPTLPEESARTPVERWILSRHEACRAEVDAALEAYRFSDAALAIHRFLWSELADWGLEMEKPRLYEGAEGERRAAASLLGWVLERTLRLLHPIMPFLTEELWQRFGTGDSIMVAKWPGAHPEHRDEALDDGFSFLTSFVSEARSNSPAIQMGVAYRRTMSERQRPLVERHADLIERLTGGILAIREDGELAAEVTRREGLRTTGEDAEAYRRRREKQLDELRSKLGREEAKLSNPAFTERASAHAIGKARAKREEMAREVDQIERELAEIEKQLG
ncbi:MAG TPA: valine--tRNA ligase, partial [Actinomycetota bacterium]|nr:valine--tRNA ligase [Actinomycetota bacterium]